MSKCGDFLLFQYLSIIYRYFNIFHFCFLTPLRVRSFWYI
ncbi:hypothetical protein HMPREF1619_03692 [Klebsiella pneumoniae 909957]|nr:hypothetical protein HMPREF1619_03692 [Klebsiella pneumoniae 909957]